VVNISHVIANYFVFLALFLTFIFPITANASIFSWLFGTANAQSIEEPTQNVQNMALLEAAISPDPAALSATSTVAIVDGTSLVSVPPVSLETNSIGDQTTFYIVHSGDTLPAIAQMFGVSVNTIVWANNIKGGKVSVGDKLIILPISGVQYTVKKGDTLQKIATTYKGDLDTIAQFNNIAPDAKLAVGDIIIIPDGQVLASESGPVVHPSGGSSGSTSGGTVHVAPGGTSPWASGALPPPSGAPAVGSLGSGLPLIIGYFERPILGGIKTQGIHGHNAVDLSAPVGTPIMAAADGEVIVAKSGGWNGGYGSYIEIQHPNGTQTLYAHLSHVSVSVGEDVTQGQVIGKLGNTGDSTGPHVHFEIHGAQNPF
jgi:murein DD-endopeptidase MepM/ murein hydrolase activator NlpD